MIAISLRIVVHLTQDTRGHIFETWLWYFDVKLRKNQVTDLLKNVLEIVLLQRMITCHCELMRVWASLQ